MHRDKLNPLQKGNSKQRNVSLRRNTSLIDKVRSLRKSRLSKLSKAKVLTKEKLKTCRAAQTSDSSGQTVLSEDLEENHANSSSLTNEPAGFLEQLATGAPANDPPVLVQLSMADLIREERRVREQREAARLRLTQIAETENECESTDASSTECDNQGEAAFSANLRPVYLPHIPDTLFRKFYTDIYSFMRLEKGAMDRLVEVVPETDCLSQLILFNLFKVTVEL